MAKWRDDDIFRAKSADMKDFLGQHEGFTFRSDGHCVQHDSLYIGKDNRWFWNSRTDNKGNKLHGNNAIDYICAVYNKSFDEAMEFMGYTPTDKEHISVSSPKREYVQHIPDVNIEPPKELALPEKAEDDKKAMAYLIKSRGIDANIVKELIDKKLIYQEKLHNNVVFVGMDEENNPKFACLRGTVTTASKPFRMDCTGSDKKYAFKLIGEERNSVFVFEAPIDALSKATIDNIKTANSNEWKKHTYLALSGAATDKALEHYLSVNPEIKEIHFCLDNDETGRNCTKEYIEKYSKLSYSTFDDVTAYGKDINDELKELIANPNLYSTATIEKEVKAAINEYSNVSSYREIKLRYQSEEVFSKEDALVISHMLNERNIPHMGYLKSDGVWLSVSKENAAILDSVIEEFKQLENKPHIEAPVSETLKTEENNNIIGNTPYRKLGEKGDLAYYSRLNNEYAKAIGKELDKANIKYSGRVYGNTTTLTINKRDRESFDKVAKAVEDKMKEDGKDVSDLRSKATDELIEQIKQGMQEVRNNPEKFKKYLDTMAKFYNYSVGNIIAICMQKPEAQLIASYTKWKNEFGYQVNKGEKGIKILAPNKYEKKGEDIITDIDKKIKISRNSSATIGAYTFEKNGNNYTISVGFGNSKQILNADATKNDVINFVEKNISNHVLSYRVESVFDISQVSPIMVKDENGKEVPHPKAQNAKLTMLGEVKESDRETVMRLYEAVARTSKCAIIIENTGNANGYYSPDESKIAIKSSLEPTHALKTLIHERTHEIFDNLEEQKKNPSTRSESEVRAESVAYTVCAKYGIDSSEYSFPYLTGWDGTKDEAVFAKEMQKIKVEADKLIRAIDTELENMQDKSIEEITAESPYINNCIFAEPEEEKNIEVSLNEESEQSEAVQTEQAEQSDETISEAKESQEEPHTSETSSDEKDNTKEKAMTALTLTVIWSEHPDIKDNTIYNFADFNNEIARLDKKQQDNRQKSDWNGLWYYKTKFQIDGMIEGEPFSYEGRYDIGDGDGTIIDHIKDCYSYELKNAEKTRTLLKMSDEQYKEHIDKCNMILNKLVPELEKQCSSCEKYLGKDLDFIPDNLYCIESPLDGTYPDYKITHLSKYTGKIVPESIKNNSFDSKSSAMNKLNEITGRNVIVVDYETMVELAEHAIWEEPKEFNKVLSAYQEQHKKIKASIEIYQLKDTIRAENSVVDYESFTEVMGKTVNICNYEKKVEFDLAVDSSKSDGVLVAESVAKNSKQIEKKFGVRVAVGDVVTVNKQPYYVDKGCMLDIKQDEFESKLELHTSNEQYNLNDFKNDYALNAEKAISAIAKSRNIEVNSKEIKVMAMLDRRVSNFPSDINNDSIRKYLSTSISQANTIINSKETLGQITATRSPMLRKYVGELMPLSKLNSIIAQEKQLVESGKLKKAELGDIALKTDIATFAHIKRQGADEICTTNFRMHIAKENYKDLYSKIDDVLTKRMSMSKINKEAIYQLKYTHLKDCSKAFKDSIKEKHNMER